MNLRLAQLLKLHGLYCAPAGEGGADAGTGEDVVEDQAEEIATDAADEQEEVEQPAGDGEAQEAAADPADDGEIVVSLGGEEPAEEEDPARAPPWLRDLRKSNREKDKRIRELEQQVASSAPAPAKIVLGERPKLADFDYDEDRHAAALDEWHAKKADADRQEREAKEATEKQRSQWLARLDAVVKAGEALKVRDSEDAIQAFEGYFSPVQQGIIIGGPDDAKTSAMLRVALGKNPAEARKLAAITDPVKFAVAIGKLETKLTIQNRKPAPTPDTPVRSGVAGAGASEIHLKQLHDKARSTGDYGAYLAAKRARQAKTA